MGQFLHKVPRSWPTSRRVRPANLDDRLTWARARIPFQHKDELFDAMDDGELDEVANQRKRLRRKARHLEEQQLDSELQGRRRQLREQQRIDRLEERQRRWQARAHANRNRTTSADARLASRYRNATWASWRLRAAMGIGMGWSGVNVGRNLIPVIGPSGATWWAQFTAGRARVSVTRVHRRHRAALIIAAMVIRSDLEARYGKIEYRLEGEPKIRLDGTIKLTLLGRRYRPRHTAVVTPEQLAARLREWITA